MGMRKRRKRRRRRRRRLGIQYTHCRPPLLKRLSNFYKRPKPWHTKVFFLN